ncbi:MAG: hypothetical protein ACI4WG_05510 [Erysipelotrichaceae bacterium]
MDINSVKKLCKDIGEVKKYKVDYGFFGNIELEIQTLHNVFLIITSDRGEFSCCIRKKHFFCDRLIPLCAILKDDKRSFDSLKSIIDYLIINLETIEKS